jgi:plastocyanin
MRVLRLAALFAGAVALAGALPDTNAQAPNGQWITIKGQVKLEKAPQPKEVDVANHVDKNHCLSKGKLFYEDLIVNPKTHGVKNVIVWLRPATKDRKDPFPQDKIHPSLAKATPKTHVVDQPCCQFEPRVVAARAGDTIEFKNSAPVNHNVNFSGDDNEFNQNVPPSGSKKTDPLKAQSSPVTFKCDIHPWMAGRARVFDHPYFAVTDENGNFEIKLAPKGDWNIVYWHENGFHKGRDGVLGFPLKGNMKGDTLDLQPIELELPKAN